MIKNDRLKNKLQCADRIDTIYMKIVPSVVEGLLLVLPLINFLDRFYLNPTDEILASFELPFYGIQTVLLDFFVFFIIFAIFNYVFLFTKKRFLCAFSYLNCLMSGCLALYRYNEIFSVKLFFLIIIIISLSIRLEKKKSIPLMVLSVLVYTVVLQHPDFLGIVEKADVIKTLPFSTIIFYVVILLITVFFSLVYKGLVTALSESLAINSHLNLNMTQMTAFNQELQEYAKNKGGEAAQAERLRITRDLHDSCGYVFVNIMCLMEACCSAKEMEWGRVKETFETVRTLASHGLQETRKTLRTIREIENPMDKGLDSLYEIRRIFQNVTNIKVSLDKGNMKSDYGPAVNKVLIRAMQEGLTNSVRHGMATEVSVNFREDGDCLYMTILDNGIGSKNVVKGIGLAGMEERLRAVGGVLSATGGTDGGFRLEIKIPVIRSMMEDYEKSKANAS